MKNFKVFFSMMLALTMLGSCASDENMVKTDGGRVPSIRLTLGGSAKSAASRADIPAEANERAVNSLLALIFDTHKGFYKTVEAQLAGDAYEVMIEDDATYDLYFVANADADLRTKLENIADTARAVNAVTTMSQIIATQSPDGDAFLMVSTVPKRVTTTLTKTEDLGTVALTRLSARFDIVNKAEGVTVNKLTFKNRAVKAALRNSNYMPVLDGLFDAKVYDNLSLVGNRETPTTYRHQIYSFRNTSMDPDSIPALTIEYSETDVDGKTVEREHVIKLVDPNAPAGTPLAVASNNLYTITLSKAYKLDFELTVEDWNEAETFNVPDLEVVLDPDVQEELNKKLLVYDLFADNYVQSIDFSAKTATFFSSPVNGNEYPIASLFSYTDLNKEGIFANDAVLTVDGEKYRVPTLGELELLVPCDDRYVTNSSDPDILWTKPSFGGARYSGEQFTETVYMKNGNDNYPLVTEITADTDEAVAFSGTSQLRWGAETRKLYLNDATGYYCDADDADQSFSRRSCYGVRFQGTDQYSAYKWEPCVEDENGVLYIAIKIKALPQNTDLTVYDITDNYAFWRSGYIEIKMPYTGYGYQSTGGAIVLGNPQAFYIWASSKVPEVTNNYYYLGANQNSMYLTGSGNSRRALRLVKVKE